jgi:hypothetical protein
MAIITTNGSFNATSAVTSTTLNAVADAATFSDPVDGTSLELKVDGKLGIKDDGVTTAKVLDANVTVAKIGGITDSLKVIGRTTAGAGAAEEVTINDDDDLLSASAITLATDESIKAYVDTEISAGAVTSYKSSFVACPAEGANTVFAHSLGAVPDIVNVQLKCNSSSSGFTTGEIVMLANSYAYTSFGQGIEIDATNVTFHVGANGLLLIAPNGTYTQIDESKFEVKVIAAIL